MTNVKEFHCHMRMNLQPFEENRMYCALPGQRRECTTWPFWTLSKTLSTKWTLQTLLIYSQLQEPGKECFKCFVLRTCNFGFRSHLFLYQNFFCCQFNLKKILFQFLRLLHFQKSYMNAKLGPLIFPVHQGPCGLNTWACNTWGIPQVSNSPSSTSPLPCSEDHHLPLSDCEFSLIY